jgi:hypothetical protein
MPAGDETTGPGPGLPWAFVLDPAANVAALSEVQRRGLDAARRLVDRAVARSDHSTNGGPPGPDRQRRPEEGQAQPELVTELIRCWTELTAQVLAKLAEDRRRPPPAGTDDDKSVVVAVDGTGGSGSVRLHLRHDAEGRMCASSEIQLANPSGRTVGPLILRVYDLHAVDGHELGGSCVRFDPPVLEQLAAGSSRVVRIAVSVDRPIAAGTYRGVIQSTGAPEFSLALHVDVEAPGR